MELYVLIYLQCFFSLVYHEILDLQSLRKNISRGNYETGAVM